MSRPSKAAATNGVKAAPKATKAAATKATASLKVAKATKVTKATSNTPANISKKRKSEEDESDESEESEASLPAKKAKAATKEKVATVKKSTKAVPEAAVKQTSTITAKPKATSKTAAKATNKAASTPAPKAATKAASKANAAPTKKPTKAAEKSQAPTKPNARKRKAEEEEHDTEDEQVDDAAKIEPKSRPVKKPRTSPKPPATKIPKTTAVLNTPPTERLNVYVFGEGSAGELGLGTAKKAIDVKRPRLNAMLEAAKVGVVQVAVGGMHCVALTHDNRILTWGVNDQGALGRDTKWDAKMVDADKEGSDSEDEDNDNGLNPHESTPTALPKDSFPENVIITQVAAGDSISLAVTSQGNVYGWGTFRNNEGILGFAPGVEVQTTPALIHGISKIKSVVTGANHVLALDAKGNVFAWGAGQQNQLGRRIIERQRVQGLIPREFGLPRGTITSVAAGSYHSFAIDKNDQVYTWGLNSYGQCGIDDNAGEENAIILFAKKAEALSDRGITQMEGGAMHSAAVTSEGKCLLWGRVDGSQSGLDVSSLPSDDVIRDDKGNPRILKAPTALPIPNTDFVHVSCGPDHGIAITRTGKVFSWGFSANYQTGQGTDEDVKTATMIDNTATRDKKIIWAGCGGQFSVLTSVADAQGASHEEGLSKGKEVAPLTNGIH
ncbi:hypothetical protein MMC25_007204 [Agyrium rufum]|nr:hypothetical protein [Agyrium rufum]